MNKLGILLDDRYFEHCINRPSPENPGRLRRLFPTVKERYNGSITLVAAREAHTADIERVHSGFYLSQIRNHAARNDPFSYDRDTYLMDRSLETARLAAGGCLELADKVMDAAISHGFALIRPPGHHAEPGRGMGFCILNNVAITARYLQRVYGLNRILIIDFDVHHGNGTQECFYDSDKVLFVSLHQRDLFPFSGGSDEIGSDSGLGFTVNIPVYSQFGDPEYTYLLGKLMHNLVEQYLPQIILVSAGYDGHQDDSISGTLLTTRWFQTAATLIRQCAEDLCDSRLLFVLEGGYNPESLEKSVLATIDGLLLPTTGRVGILHSERAATLLANHPLHHFWTL
ncbi:histone deacetylase family protein [Desulfofustis limnaeus]|uniref:Histone deacetylase n=1 Tax=Desulfofustis limnaeus TaxID=2740163 RepID=A0ABN6M7U6_9BACT|nr:histone deacetylase [Desulfofustis limnaeus]BDD88943.1 histone deacetylase [Desulfofustis limnaeus]